MGLGLAVVLLPPTARSTRPRIEQRRCSSGSGSWWCWHRWGRGSRVRDRARIAPPVRPGAPGGSTRPAERSSRGRAAAGWLLFPVMSQTPGWVERSTDGSTLASFSLQHLPTRPPDCSSWSVRRSTGASPAVHRRGADAGSAAGADRQPDRRRDAGRLTDSVVQVRGEACDDDPVRQRLRGRRGSWPPTPTWSPAPTTSSWSPLTAIAATPGWWRSTRPPTWRCWPSLDRPALTLDAPRTGDRGLVMGFPGVDRWRRRRSRSPRRCMRPGSTSTTVGRFAAPAGVGQRPAAGDSGSAVVRSGRDGHRGRGGHRPGPRRVAYALDRSELDASWPPPRATVDTGECVSRRGGTEVHRRRRGPAVASAPGWDRTGG